jgi:hypothetical protein
VRPRLEVEVLEGRLCPSFVTFNITDPSQLPLQLPGVVSRGQHITFILTATTNDTTESSEGEAEFLTLTSSTGDLNVQVPLGQTMVIPYTAIQRGETFSVNSSDGDEIGTLVYVVPHGPGKPGSHQHPLLVSSDFWNWQKLVMMAYLQLHIKGGPNDPYPMDPGYLLARRWDNDYFHGPGNQVSFMFQDGSFLSRTLIGHEVNYYFQGMIAAAYGLPLGALEGIVVGYYVKVHHKKPSFNVLLAANLGFFNYSADYQAWQTQTHGGTQLLPPTPLPPSMDP